jgi:hypothetical protein
MNYFREKYPVEHELVWMIATKFNVTKASDGSSTISMTDEGAFFLAAVAGAITKNILSFLGSDLI